MRRAGNLQTGSEEEALFTNVVKSARFTFQEGSKYAPGMGFSRKM